MQHLWKTIQAEKTLGKHKMRSQENKEKFPCGLCNHRNRQMKKIQKHMKSKHEEKAISLIRKEENNEGNNSTERNGHRLCMCQIILKLINQ